MSSSSAANVDFPVRVFGGPTVLFEYGGLRFLTDPTFDAPGDYPLGGELVLTKTADSTASPEGLGRIDVALLSHDTHADNLDHSGRLLLAGISLTLTTPNGGERLTETLGERVKSLADWESVELKRPGGGAITVTAVPAIHGPGPREEVELALDQVVGFVLTGEGLPSVYVSGDNASLEAVQETADRFAPIDTAILFAGAPRFAGLYDGQPLVLDSAQAARAAEILEARRVVPVHYDSWAHFSEGHDDLVAAFAAAELTSRLDWGQRY
ncbi:MBL fold metallo-hydrolase [Streptomyces sp. NPDC048489]|uniref:MBL fold metallo-hydrolase n=1 Tax=Streptomyces sp. NPDC048489 TaxID=3154504 RepID=UPI003427C881